MGSNLPLVAFMCHASFVYHALASKKQSVSLSPSNAVNGIHSIILLAHATITRQRP